MAFTEVYIARGAAALISDRLKNNTMHRFTNMPANVFHWRTFETAVEFSPKRPTFGYAGGTKAQELVYNLLRSLAPKMPHLNFCLDLDYDVGFSEMFVYDGLECVGRVDFADTGALEFRNARIGETMLRRTSMKTLSVNKAASIIRKYFYGMTKIEKLGSVASKITSAISSAHSDTSYKRRRAKSAVMEQLEEAITSNSQLSQAVAQFFQEQGKSHVLDAYIDASDTHELVTEAYAMRGGETGLYVLAHPEEFHVYRKGDTRVRTFRREQLSDKARGALGMLKLSENNSFVDNVGFKYEADKFWVMEEIANEFNS